jgi:hypothetical protein
MTKSVKVLRSPTFPETKVLFASKFQAISTPQADDRRCRLHSELHWIICDGGLGAIQLQQSFFGLLQQNLLVIQFRSTLSTSRVNFKQARAGIVACSRVRVTGLPKIRGRGRECDAYRVERKYQDPSQVHLSSSSWDS